MAKKKMYRVQLVATLPAHAFMTVSADSEDEAREWAENHCLEADWQGADYDKPQGCDVEIFSVIKL